MVKRQTTRHLDDSDGWDCALVERVARAHGPSNNAKVGSQKGVTQKLLTTAQMQCYWKTSDNQNDSKHLRVVSLRG